MLLELRIENFAIIDKVEIHFDPGLIIFTGETGAGKSILIDAVDTMLGGRADSTFVRSGADRAIIEGVFKIPSSTNGSIQAILEREELLDDENYLTLGREIRLNGPNIARVNGRSVTASLLRKIGSYLIDVHGQSEHLSLLRVNQHIILLDRYAEVGSFFETYRNTYHQLQSVRRELAELRLAEQDAARRIDTLTYQINEIESARLQTGEEAELQAERNRLANAEGIASLVQEALFALDDGSPETPSATDLLGQVSHSLKNLIRLDQSQSALNIQAQAIFDNLVELTN
jgi:DNA repair protein RecN (Recombination protein N)